MPLDRTLTYSGVGWYPLAVAITLILAAAMRFANLTAYTLGKAEGEWAYHAWALYTGKPLPGGRELPNTGPLYLILEASTYFLFGVSDAIARSSSVLLGIGLVVLIYALRPFISRSSAIGMALLAALSPTLVFASRNVSPVMLIAFLSLLAIVSLLRAGRTGTTHSIYWAGVFGASLAGLIASGPEGITAIIALAIGIAVALMADGRTWADGSSNPVGNGIRAITTGRSGLAASIGTFVLVTLILFSRLLSNASALGGFFETFADWGRMMATANSSTPTQFFLYATLLYEFLAVVFVIVAMSGGMHQESKGPRYVSPALFLTWFLAALILQSLASGRQPGQLTLVTLPLVLAGGLGLGQLFDHVAWHRLFATRDGGVLAAWFGLFFGLVGVVTLTARTNDPAAQNTEGQSTLRVIFVLVLVVLPLGFIIGREMLQAASRRIALYCGLIVVAVLLGVLTIRSTTQLAYVRGDTGTELAGQNIPAPALRTFLDRTYRLSRDLSVTDANSLDNTGSYGLNIVVDPTLQWPFVWYLRDFNNLQVATAASWGDADMVIAPTGDGMGDAGYVVESRTMFNRVPASFESLTFGDIFGKILHPSEWYPAFKFLMYRDMAAIQEPQQVSVGYTFRLSNQMDPASGPFDLTNGQALGPGTALGQLDNPTGIAMSNDGQVIWIVDAANQRIQRFGSDGSFIGAISAQDDPRLGLGYFDGAQQGAGDITIGEDNLVYVADTWNHRIMVLDPNGNLVRELGATGQQADLLDSPDPSGSPGLFFGPRSVAISNGEIYVSDTGNERIQVFAPDGTFLRAFGGYGTEPGKLLEPVGITIGHDGLVYVADTGNARLSVFTREGQPVTQIPVPEWQNHFGDQMYLKTGPDGMIYLGSPSTNQILAFNGTSMVPVESPALDHPVGIAITADNQMLVTEPGVSKELQFPIQLPAGFTVTTVATPGATPAASPVASPVATPAVEPTETQTPVG